MLVGLEDPPVTPRAIYSKRVGNVTHDASREDTPKSSRKLHWVTVAYLGCLSLIPISIVGQLIYFAIRDDLHPPVPPLDMIHSRMQTLLNAELRYANDHDGLLQPEMSSAQSAKPYLHPYLYSDEACLSLNPDGGEILGNPLLAGKEFAAILKPEDTIVFYDSKPWKREALVAYADGKVRFIDWSQLRPRLALNPFGATRTHR